MLGSDPEDAEGGTQIQSVLSVKTTDQVRTLYTEICMYDIGSDRFFEILWDHARKGFGTAVLNVVKNSGADPGYKVSVASDSQAAGTVKELLKKCDSNLSDPIIKICRGKEKTNMVSKTIESAREKLFVHMNVLSHEDLELTDMLLTKASEGIGIYVSCWDGPAVIAGEIKQKISEAKSDNPDIVFEFAHGIKRDCSEICSDSGICMIFDVEWSKCTGTCTLCETEGYFIACSETANDRFNLAQSMSSGTEKDFSAAVKSE